MKRKLLACLCAGAMILSLAACGAEDPQTVDSPVEDTQTPQAEPEPTPTLEPEPVTTLPATLEASIDFEDGNMDFVSAYLVPANAADVELSIVDYNGSNALQIKNLNGKVPYIGIDISSLLGGSINQVASIEMTMGTTYEDGSFSATSGKVTTWWGEKRETFDYDWSVYLENQNPKKAVVKLKDDKPLIADNNNILVINLRTDTGLETHGGAATLYIDNIRFLDASGNLIHADTTVAFNPPPKFEAGGVDMTNLVWLKDPVTLDGFAVTGDAWAQAGVDITEEIQELLVPGAIVEIEYSSEDGDIWLVVTGAENGWVRVNNDGKSLKNLSHNIAQIPYEDIMDLCGGSDSSALGGQIQGESSSTWEIFSVKIGQPSGLTDLKDTTDLAGFAVTGDAWAQAGIDITEDIQALLIPGAIVEVEYTSESGDMWLVVTGAENGWTRISNEGASKRNGQIAQFTYEEIMAACGGADSSALTGQIQGESDSPWEIFSVKIGVPAGITAVSGITWLDGFAVTGDAWAQAGVGISEDIQGLLVPGSVVIVEYASESGNIWLVVTGAENGWTRISNEGASARNGQIATFTYEEIMAACGGSDSSALTGDIQGESDTPWEIFRVGIGTAVQ